MGLISVEKKLKLKMEDLSILDEITYDLDMVDKSADSGRPHACLCIKWKPKTMNTEHHTFLFCKLFFYVIRLVKPVKLVCSFYLCLLASVQPGSVVFL